MKKALIFITIVTSILLVLQIRSFKTVEFLIQRSEPAGILSELRIFQLANIQLKKDIEDKEKSLKNIYQQVSDSKITEDETNRLYLLSGEIPVEGEGIEITFSSDVKEFWISDLVAQLVGAGAEAIAVNNIRLTEKTAGFRNIGGGLLMRRDFIKPPLVIAAIGSKKILKQAINQNGGILDRIKNSTQKLKINLEERDKIIIPALGSLTQ
ncbi:DUF881 domain-containing protein [Candidatus Peregrinibacteria bacterium]|nr:DUF881 domain-containing protein [Candidatus Peregrinibacteria bacterium]